jgi:hypothetical protein
MYTSLTVHSAGMMKTSDRLKWFLDFAQLAWVSNLDPEEFLLSTPESITGLKELKEWEYLKLKEEVIEFIGGDDPHESFRFGIEKEILDEDASGFPIWGLRPIVSEATAEFLTREELAALCVRAGYYLDAYIGRVIEVTDTTAIGPMTFRKGAPRPVIPAPRKKTIVTKKSETINFGRPTVSFNMGTATWFIESSSPAHLFFIRFGLVLMEEGTSQIQKCPECQRAFYRVRKQKYCSKTCINRVSRRKWLENPKNKKKERQWSHERYERRVKEKTNGKVKVQSRVTKKRGNS